jgi:hypothetical protein
MENKNSVCNHLDGPHETHMNKTSEIDISENSVRHLSAMEQNRYDF